MKPEDLKNLFEELLCGMIERKREAEKGIDEIGGAELKRRSKELDVLYPGQVGAVEHLLGDESDALVEMIENIGNLSLALPHSLSEYAWDMAEFFLKAGILQVQENKKRDAERRKAFVKEEKSHV